MELGTWNFEHVTQAQALKEIYDLNRESNQQILRQIDDITAILNKENIQPVFLKGTANLLDGLYSDLGERMMAILIELYNVI